MLFYLLLSYYVSMSNGDCVPQTGWRRGDAKLFKAYNTAKDLLTCNRVCWENEHVGTLFYKPNSECLCFTLKTKVKHWPESSTAQQTMKLNCGISIQNDLPAKPGGEIKANFVFYFAHTLSNRNELVISTNTLTGEPSDDVMLVNNNLPTDSAQATMLGSSRSMRMNRLTTTKKRTTATQSPGDFLQTTWKLGDLNNETLWLISTETGPVTSTFTMKPIYVAKAIRNCDVRVTFNSQVVPQSNKMRANLSIEPTETCNSNMHNLTVNIYPTQNLKIENITISSDGSLYPTNAWFRERVLTLKFDRFYLFSQINQEMMYRVNYGFRSLKAALLIDVSYMGYVNGQMQQSVKTLHNSIRLPPPINPEKVKMCPASHRHPYLNGRYCCKYTREKFGAVLKFTSVHCKDDAWVKCDNSAGVCFNYKHVDGEEYNTLLDTGAKTTLPSANATAMYRNNGALFCFYDIQRKRNLCGKIGQTKNVRVLPFRTAYVFGRDKQSNDFYLDYQGKKMKIQAQDRCLYYRDAQPPLPVSGAQSFKWKPKEQITTVKQTKITDSAFSISSKGISSTKYNIIFH